MCGEVNVAILAQVAAEHRIATRLEIDRAETGIGRCQGQQLLRFLAREGKPRDYQSLHCNIVIRFFGEMLDAPRVIEGNGLRWKVFIDNRSGRNGDAWIRTIKNRIGDY